MNAGERDNAGGEPAWRVYDVIVKRADGKHEQVQQVASSAARAEAIVDELYPGGAVVGVQLSLDQSMVTS